MQNQLTVASQEAVISRAPAQLHQHPVMVYLAGIAPSSRRVMHGALDSIANMVGAQDALSMDWAQLRFQHVALIRSELARWYAPATANLRLSALRGVLRAARRLGQMTADDYHQAIDVGTIRGDRLPAGRHVPTGELRALMDACAADASAAGVRDAAIIGLLYAGGLRRAEVVALDLTDYNRAIGSLKVTGKGDKDREVPVNDGAKDALDDWLALRGPSPGPIFCPINKGGKLLPGSITTQALYKLVGKRAAEAGVPNVTPHDLRRSFATQLLDEGADLAIVQRLLGHADPRTTIRYDRRGEHAKRKAIELLHVPYERRFPGA